MIHNKNKSIHLLLRFDSETTNSENSLLVLDDEEDFKNNQATYLTVITDPDDVFDEASSIESSQDYLFSEIDKAITLIHKEFVNQDLLKPNPAKEVFPKSFTKSFNHIKSTMPKKATFDSLVKSKKARILEPKFHMTLAVILDESKMVPVLVDGNLEVEISGIQYDSRLVTSGNLFVCCVVSKNDRHMFLREADKRGAVVVKLTLITITSLWKTISYKNLTSIEVESTSDGFDEGDLLAAESLEIYKETFWRVGS
ncbi:unnamed protein product [Vicia faba]|uniref:Polyprotein n=1 Tax=Vicia faba TaxID=3906 RepID=A0AAV1AJ94_VICFA|nr:unnamed protein product [Vicia faba]